MMDRVTALIAIAATEKVILRIVNNFSPSNPALLFIKYIIFTVYGNSKFYYSG
jgi:hypothetical protein